MPLGISLLTTRQAADILGVHYNTLRKWQQAGRGPDYVSLDPDNPSPDRRERRQAVRYRLEDLQAWWQHNPGWDRPVPPARRAPEVPHTLTDRQWAVVRAAFVWEFKMERLAGGLDLDAARGQLEALLHLAVEATGARPEALIQRNAETGTDVLRAWIDYGWLDIAFRALADDPEFKFILVHQTMVMPHQAPRSAWEPGPMAALALRTTLVGPLPDLRAGLPPKLRYTDDQLPQPTSLVSGFMMVRDERERKRRRDRKRREEGRDPATQGDAAPPGRLNKGHHPVRPYKP